jgi:hypothetical protein
MGARLPFGPSKPLQKPHFTAGVFQVAAVGIFKGPDSQFRSDRAAHWKGNLLFDIRGKSVVGY